jgi:hypothetical protein
MRARLNSLILAAVLFVLNLWMVRSLLTAEFLNQMSSIEGAYIGLARYIAGNWPDLSWFPLWYGGVPFQNTYPPLLHLTVAAVSKLLGMTPALAYHAVTAIFYSLGPVTLFFLALRISKSRVYSFAAAMLYSLSSPSAFLIPAIRWSMGSVWRARRLECLVRFGEGPHVAAMTLVPLALLLLVVAFEKRRPLWWVLAGMAASGVALTNWLGAFALAIAIPAWLLSRQDTNARHWLAAAAAGTYAYLLACPWIPPSTVLGVQRNEMFIGGQVSGTLTRLACAAGTGLAVILLRRALFRYKAPAALRFSVLFLAPFACLTLSAEWLGLTLLPQARRCHLEMEMGIALTAAFAAKLILDGTKPRVRMVAACALMLAAIYPAVKYHRYAQRLIERIDIRQTIEYREAEWFRTHMHGRRVFAPGSVGFFLNAFTDTPQFNGGFYAAVLDPAFFHFSYQITSGDAAGAQEGRIAELILKAAGVDAIGVSGAGSREAFKDFHNPKKFEGILPEVWRDGADSIYLVPRRSASLAHVIRKTDLPARRIVNGLDIEPLRAYVRAMDDPSLPAAEMNWRNRQSATIQARMAKDQILAVQVSYHPGWTARVNGDPRPVTPDKIGQIVIEPGCAGACVVEIAYDGGMEMRVARVISWSALTAGLCWILVAFLVGRRSLSRAARRTGQAN